MTSGGTGGGSSFGVQHCCNLPVQKSSTVSLTVKTILSYNRFYSFQHP